MREILKNVKEKLASKYLENSDFKGKKKFKSRNSRPKKFTFKKHNKKRR